MKTQNGKATTAKRKPTTKAATARVASLEREVAALRRQIDVLHDTRTVVVPITTFDPEPFELCKAILAVVQPEDDSFVASFFDANINASGHTEADAVANLKDMMIALFESLAKEKKKRGKGPARQFAILQSLMRRKG